MIYESENKPFFDDTFVRGVDKIVDGLYNKKHCEEYQHTLNPIAYVMEFRSAFLSIPRQTGKTTYLKKLYLHMNQRGHFPLIVTRKQIDVKTNYPNNFEAKTLSQLNSFRHQLLGQRNRHDVILFDEVNQIEAKEVLDVVVMYNSSRINFVLGLYT